MLDSLVDILDVATVLSFFSSLPWAKRRLLVAARTLCHVARRRERRQAAAPETTIERS